MPPLPHFFVDNKLEKVLVDLTARLLNSIAAGDWATYTELCSPDLTAFEPEAGEHQIQGLPFHKFFFDLASSKTGPPPAYGVATETAAVAPQPVVTTTVVSPHVRFLCPDRTAALITYVRVVQRAEADGRVNITSSQETRVWELDKKGGTWMCVHFHRSVAASPAPTPQRSASAHCCPYVKANL
ncbi:Calcium/calmodulin-dependent protein kinase type II subunit gamma [Geranomyces variabilis]|uniref:Calcium/calmodulin-dependent protein kinase type II subunit gamma n=1 Tax=Geranomyces variabilis TaxID=109894 RepID=A0AAD5XMW8_9FUNG|nr:Calcium/calmodulin-dependent protein kinase type II subunit gamma [Geranomyces variabilis]